MIQESQPLTTVSPEITKANALSAALSRVEDAYAVDGRLRPAERVRMVRILLLAVPETAALVFDAIKGSRA